MLRATGSGRRALRTAFDPRRSALLVLDLQSCFLDPEAHAFVPSAPAILPGIQALAQAYRQKSLPVIFTRHANTTADAGQMSAWWRELITPHDPQSAVVAALDVGDSLVLPKTQYDAFYGTSLDAELRRRRVSQVVITGVMTHLCCESTARTAFMRGFQVFFPVDGTATYNQDFHRASLLNLGHGFATLSLVSEILDALGEAR